MGMFTVTQVIDGDTFAVHPRWSWNGEQGDRVRPAGYDAPEMGGLAGAAAKHRLKNLLEGKSVELTNPRALSYGRLVCDVFLNGQNLAAYFPKR
jgi:endonuclease YncB( thermonuclease family)